MKAVEELQKEGVAESVCDEDVEQIVTKPQEDSVEVVADKETANLQENVDENDVIAEETQQQVLETEKMKSSEEVANDEETQIEEMVESSAELNAAVKNKILSFKNKYGEGTEWRGNHGGIQCIGFAKLMADEVFGSYPDGLRSAADKKLSKGWTCYHVTPSNYDNLAVEPGDLIDSPFNAIYSHTAMVLSVSNGKITCVQCNKNTDYKVYWTQYFNYNSNNATLKQIYNRFHGQSGDSGGIIRLWKPSDTLKNNAKAYATPTGASQLKITGQTSPGSLKVGSYWTCTGTITSNYSINEVSGYILKSDNSTKLYSKTINPNTTSYSLANGEIDKALLFNKLSEGTYYYLITAKDTSGKTVQYNPQFTVGNPKTPCSFSGQITSPVNSSTTDVPKVSIQATATDSYAINSFKINLAAGTYNNSVTANASKSGNSYICNYTMDLPAEATYTVTVDVVCANGATHRVGANTFTYKKKACSFSGTITAPAENAATTTSSINIQATASDTYAINNFVIKLFWNGTQKTETAAASVSGNSYVCNYNLSLPTQTSYRAEIYAACANGATHKIGERTFVYDSTPPVVSDLRAYKDNGDFYCSANVTDSVSSVVKSWMIVKDEKGKEKRFEGTSNGSLCVWSNIAGLWPCGEYTITFYAQDQAGNIGYNTLQNVVIAKATYDVNEFTLSVGEERKVKFLLNTLFEVEEVHLLDTDDILQVTDEGTQISVKGLKPGSTRLGVEWTVKNNAYADQLMLIQFTHVVPQAPKIINISTAVKGYDIITYEPVQYAKTYELYRKRVDKDTDYQLCETFTDNKSHSFVVDHTDKSDAYLYRLRVKAEETTDLQTNEKYYPTSDFSNEVYAERQEEESEVDESQTESEPSIEDGDITDGLYISGLETKTYTGTAIKQDITVYYNKLLLKEGTDYTLSYKNNINAGNATLTVKAKGNLTGTVTKNFVIQPREINDSDVIIEDAVYLYDKKAHKKAPKITYKGKVLKEKKDFEISSYNKGDYTAAGTYTMTIKGIGNFAGTTQDAKIIITDKSKNISKATVAKIPVQDYQNGAAVEVPDKLVKVTLAKTELKKDIDYTLRYANNTRQGNATLIISGKGEYVGTKKVNFTIKRVPTALTEDMLANKSSIKAVTIQKNGAKPKPKLMLNNNTLAEGRDYVLSYKNNKKIGTGTIIIKGKGDYTDSIEIPFQITAKALTSSDITIRVSNVAYIGKPNKYQSLPILTDSDGGVLVKNKDYTIEAYQAGKTTLDKSSNPEESTQITVTIKGKGNYEGTAKATYKIEGISIAKAVIKVTPKSYTGKPVTIEESDITSAVLKTGKTKQNLRMGRDYEIAAYSNNLKKGTATVVFRGIGNYAGEKTVKFKITATAISDKNTFVKAEKLIALTQP